MAKGNDILLNIDGDVYAKNGDFVVGVADEQNIQLILAAMPGEWKQHPIVGVGLIQHFKGSLDSELRRDIQKGLSADGYKARMVKMENDKLTIDV